MIFAAKTEKGKRKKNEDCFHISAGNDTPCFVAVSDGMGGHAGGEIASSLTISEVLTYLSDLSELDPEEKLESSISGANLSVYRMAHAKPELNGMGATLVCALLSPSGVIAANIGDSRMYLLHQGYLKQITVDHSYVEELVRSGAISREQAKNHPRRNLITRAIGIDIVVEPDIFSFPWEKDDLLLLCSDGLHGSVNDTHMQFILQSDSTPAEKCEALISEALKNGSTDNITVAIAIHDGKDANL